MMSVRKLWKNNNDDAISPVIGTILMVAATVIIAGAVYAAVNSYNGKAAKAGPDASFKAQSMDTDGDGLEDMIKVTYLAGPTGSDAIKVTVKNATSGSAVTGTTMTTWNPGDYQTFDPSAPGSYFVTALFGESTVLDQTLSVKE